MPFVCARVGQRIWLCARLWGEESGYLFVFSTRSARDALRVTAKIPPAAKNGAAGFAWEHIERQTVSDFLIPNIILSNPVNIFGLFTTTTFITLTSSLNVYRPDEETGRYHSLKRNTPSAISATATKRSMHFAEKITRQISPVKNATIAKISGRLFGPLRLCPCEQRIYLPLFVVL